jgi:hypothetical protein
MGINVPGYRWYRSALRNPRQVQEKILAGYLRRNEDTVFGRKYHFAKIRSLRDFQAQLPLSSYDDYTAYVDRIAAGETGCLTREPVKLFALSSGSTRAAKWLPYTASLQVEFRRAVAPWIVDLMANRPTLLGGPAYWSISPAIDRKSERTSVVPVGFDEDSASLGGIFKQLVDIALAVPGTVSQIQDIELFRRVSLLFLLRTTELRLISVWHPSFIGFLLAPLVDQWDQLVSDVENGFHLAEPAIQIPADRARARVLARLDPRKPTRIWPNLALISCWGDAHAAEHLAEVRKLFPGVDIQVKGLIATEAFASLPFRKRCPLAVTSHFFEFLDMDGRAHPAWDLELGGVYSLVVTTAGGLYRYKLEDRVEVTGTLERTPCLRFLGKEDRVSDLFGEKLSEGFVAGTIRKVFARTGAQARFAMLAPECENGVSRYLLFLELAQDPPPSLAAELDAELRENPHYDYCIRIGQLAPTEVLRVQKNAYECYVQRLRSDNQRLGDIKPSPLSTLLGWRHAFMQGATAHDSCN